MGEATKKLEPTISVQDAFKPYEHFCKAMIDAYAVIDMDGAVVKSNPLLAKLVGKSGKEIRKANSLDALLSFSVAGQRLQSSHILKNDAPTRYDEINARTIAREDLTLIMGIYPLYSEGGNQGEKLGCFILIRDVTDETNLQGKYVNTKKASVTDALTGLHTRRYFEELLTTMTKNITELPESSDQRKISLIICDIDHFKHVNDEYGHQAGDHVLQRTAEIMKTALRKSDTPCRYGGEEFLIILPAEKLPGAIIAAEKVRKKIADEVFTFEGRTIPVTISMGVVQLIVDKENYQTAIKRADEALYFSKENGRNAVSVHDGNGIKKCTT